MCAAAPIFLFTDFGSADLYVGQVKAVLHEAAPASALIDLLNDAPSFNVRAAAHVLAALALRLPAGAVTLAVVDPAVGSARDAIALEADGRWYVGPDNGLISVVAARARQTRCFPLSWVPPPQSVSFHGRDLFAPAAARIARGDVDWSGLRAKQRLDVDLGDGDLSEIIYIDHYGNAMTGARAANVDRASCIEIGARSIRHALVFSEAAPGALFWYENSIGLIEIAANRASAASLLGLCVGWPLVLSHAGALPSGMP
jgi:S-adenosylmethionine hydrolase